MQSYLVAGSLHWTASIIEGASFSSFWDKHFRYGFAFPAHSASAKTIIRGLTGYCIHCHGTDFIANDPMLVEFTGLTTFPIILNSWRGRMMEWPFEDSVTMLAKLQYFAGLGQVSSQGYTCSESTYSA